MWHKMAQCTYLECSYGRDNASFGHQMRSGLSSCFHRTHFDPFSALCCPCYGSGDGSDTIRVRGMVSSGFSSTEKPDDIWMIHGLPDRLATHGRVPLHS